MRSNPLSQDDGQFTEELDTAFYGIDNRREAGLLRTTRGYGQSNQEMPNPGLLADAMNVRLEDGNVRRRGGIFAPVDLNAPAFPALLGSGTWQDPQESEWLVALCATSTYLTASNRSARQIPLPAGVFLDAPLEVIQTFDKLLLLRGVDHPPLEWSGNYAEPWKVVQRTLNEDSPTFLEALPPTAWGAVSQDRLFFAVDGDTLGWSDLLDYTRTDSTLARERFNQGESDNITAAAPYQGNRLIVFKQRCIYFMDNLTPAMDAYRVDKLPVNIGCVARRTVQAVGGELYFLGQGGLYSLGQTINSGLRGEQVPLSWPVQAWIDRIQWTHVAGAVAAFDSLRNLYQLAVPIDGSTVNNALLSYDTVAQQWVSLDKFDRPTGAALGVPGGDVLDPARPWEIRPRTDLLAGINHLHLHPVFGRATIVMATGVGRFFALGEAEYDTVAGVRYEPLMRVRTRGYLLGTLQIKQVREITPSLATQDAELTLVAWTDGVSEAQPLLVAQRRSRFGSALWNQADYNPENVNNDFARPDRQDYTWKVTDAPQPYSGITLGLLQDWQEPCPVRARDCRWLALELICTTGRVTLRALTASGPQPPHRMRPATG